MKLEISPKTVSKLAIGKSIADTLITGFIVRKLPSGRVTFS
jgi:hypothetical protein